MLRNFEVQERNQARNSGRISYVSQCKDSICSYRGIDVGQQAVQEREPTGIA